MQDRSVEGGGVSLPQVLGMNITSCGGGGIGIIGKKVNSKKKKKWKKMFSQKTETTETEK